MDPDPGGDSPQFSASGAWLGRLWHLPGRTVTSIFQANGSRTLPATFGNCGTQGAVGHGTRSFLVQCMNRNYGGSLFKASWNGNTHEYSPLFTTGTMNPNGIGGGGGGPAGLRDCGTRQLQHDHQLPVERVVGVGHFAERPP